MVISTPTSVKKVVVPPPRRAIAAIITESSAEEPSISTMEGDSRERTMRGSTSAVASPNREAAPSDETELVDRCRCRRRSSGAGGLERPEGDEEDGENGRQARGAPLVLRRRPTPACLFLRPSVIRPLA